MILITIITIIIVIIIIIITLTKNKQLPIPWVPKTGPKIKKEIQKFGFRVAFQTGPNLINILCKNIISQYQIFTLEGPN